MGLRDILFFIGGIALGALLNHLLAFRFNLAEKKLDKMENQKSELEAAALQIMQSARELDDICSDFVVFANRLDDARSLVRAIRNDLDAYIRHSRDKDQNAALLKHWESIRNSLPEHSAAPDKSNTEISNHLADLLQTVANRS